MLYIGVTNNLLRRVYEHKNKLIDGFTRKYNIGKLVYVENFTDVNEAIAVEKKIKGWLRIKKIKLIESKNPQWKDLTLFIEDNFYISRVKQRDPSLHSG